ncbi:MAG: DUF362 domain-containing protein [Limnochordia bacterium]|jgi:uncharacterized protein (DUF362 family)
MSVVTIPFTDYLQSVTRALDALEAHRILAQQDKIIIKPNLVVAKAPPVTTAVDCVAAIVKYCQEHTRAEIIVAEGAGGTTTDKCYKALGYTRMARELGVKLVDLDKEPMVNVTSSRAKLYKEFPLPAVLTDGYLISVPCLKDHSICDVTLSLKNMIGICPAKKFSGFWSFRKSKVHEVDVDQAIVDIVLHRPIDLALIDGAVGLQGSHLSGQPCRPPKKIIIAGYDPVAVDFVGAEILGWRPENIAHLALAKKTFSSQ